MCRCGRARASLRGVLAMQFGKLRTQGLDAITKQTTVGFELGFAGTAQADTALLTFQVSPAADKAGRQMLQLGKLNLNLAFMALGALGENIEDQAGAIKHPRFQHPFEIALLRRRQGVIEDDDVELQIGDGIRNLLRLAGTDKQRGVRTGAFACYGSDRLCASGLGQQEQFIQTRGKIAFAEIQAD